MHIRQLDVEQTEKERKRQETIDTGELDDYNEEAEEYVDVYCPYCGEELSYMKWQIKEGKLLCLLCEKEFTFSEVI